DIAGLIKTHSSTLTNITINFRQTTSPSINSFWDAIAECTRNERLTMRNAEVTLFELQSFWRACSTARTLEMYGIIFKMTAESALPDFKASDMSRVLHLRCSNIQHLPSEDFINWFLRRIPNLRSLHWSGSEIDDKALNAFCQGLSLNSWPDLDSLDIRPSAFMLDKNLARILDLLSKPLILFRVPRSEFGDQAFRSMQQRGFFDSIRELNLNRCLGVTSAMVQTILSSCPVLEVCFAGRSFYMSDIVHGRPWICRRMRSLGVNIDVDQSVEDPDFLEQEHAVYKQLSIMTHIQRLAVNNEKASTQSSRTLDLRLGAGLGLLVGMRWLEEFWVKGDQWMAEEDVLWIVENLPRLRHFTGRLHVEEDKMLKLKKMFTDRGIAVYDNSL
ncbi:hypothetical protein EDD21DRAFT_435899, partial [Dissophora ornata]